MKLLFKKSTKHTMITCIPIQLLYSEFNSDAKREGLSLNQGMLICKKQPVFIIDSVAAFPLSKKM